MVVLTDEQNVCFSKPCKNAGKCISLENNSFACQCVKTFTGKTCTNGNKLQKKISYVFIFFCIFAVNYCQNHECQNDATCENGPDDYSCKCKSGYSGKHCAAGGLSKCTSDYCHNKGLCYKFQNKLNCLCRGQFDGERCEICK